jgi:alcohol dehydrogenase (cytochrome c)
MTESVWEPIGKAALGATLLLALAGCQQNPSHGHGPQTTPSAYATGKAGLGQPPQDDGQWVMAPKDYSNTRYSSLNQINTGNVNQLKLAWSFSTGSTKGHEAAPIVVNNTMYVITPFPNNLYALDLATGKLKWTYKPNPDPNAQGVACCDVVNRGGAYYNGRIYYATLDLNAIAVDAETGKEVWRTPLGDINKGESVTMAPIVVKGKVLVGNSGGEFGARGWLTALDAGSGKLAWRAYSTGPDSDVLIGPNFKPYYSDHKGKDLGVHTWPGDAWKIGGGTVWGWISYDPELDLIYDGSANPGPWNPEVRPGDNKWTSTIFARRPETGDAIWAYQMNPHDDFDYDGVNECVLADINIDGQTRKVLMHPDRNGYMYVIDRTNGQVISAQAFGFINTSTHVDLNSGRIEMVKEKSPKTGVVTRDVCPAAPGAKDWTPSAYSYRTGLLYIPHNNLCMEVEALQANYIAGTPYIAARNRFYGGPGGHRGEYTAFDPAQGKVVWKINENFPVWSGTLVTAGDVAFYGTMDRWFKAVDVHDGKELWKFQAGSGIIGQPVTYKGPDGKQYIAVLAGVGGWAGAVVSGGLDTRDGTGAAGFTNASSDLPQYTNAGGTLYVFGLP